MSREYDQIKGLIKNAEECLSVAYKRGYKDGKNSVDPKTKMADFAIHSAIEELEQESCENCIKISEGMTNGDMIKAMFPNLNFKETKDFFERWIMNGGGIRCYIDWWNNPYRKEQE